MATIVGASLLACYASHETESKRPPAADPPDGHEAERPAGPDPCAIDPRVSAEIRAIFWTGECFADFHHDRGWVYFNGFDDCVPWACDCPRPDCAPEDDPLDDCLYDREKHRRPADFPQNYCLFMTREQCECRCRGICS
jgi:hypothetical protein